MQRHEMKKAFYSGYFKCLITQRDQPGLNDVSDDEGAAALQKLHDEAQDFFVAGIYGDSL